MGKKTGLGQGVNLLFGENEEKENYFLCDINKIIPNKEQPRTHFSEESLEELAQSIRENGIIQPLVVTNGDNNTYTLIAGERRLRASILAGLREVPVITMEVSENNTLLELALIENIQRTDLNPIEEAEAYQRLIEKFGYTQEETAKKVGKKRSTVSNSLRLLNLPELIKEDIVAGTLSEGHGRALLRIANNYSILKKIRDDIVKKKLSVRQTETLVKKATVVTKPQQLIYETKPQVLSAAYCKSLVNALTNKLSSKVAIHQNGTRGKLEIEYYSSDDLDRLLAIILNE